MSERPRRMGALPTLLVGFLLMFPAFATAQRLTIEPLLRVETTYSTNAAFVPGSDARHDLIVELAPGFSVLSVGPRSYARGSLEFDYLHYLNSTEANRLIPRGRLEAGFQPIEKLLFLDASLVATPTYVNPFGPRPDGASTVNNLNTVQYALTPSLRHALTARTRVEASAEAVRTQVDAATDAEAVSDINSLRTVARLEVDPRPAGGLILLERTDTRFIGSPQPSLREEFARASLTYDVGDLTVGARGGTERNNYALVEDASHTYVGWEARWRPTERTEIRGYRDRRYFGAGWDASVRHRMPWFAIVITDSRNLVTYQQNLFSLGVIGDVNGQLDAMLTTRVPDPTERARQVQQLLARFGIPTTLGQPLAVYSQRPSLVTQRSATLSFLGTRDAVALSYFSLRSEDLAGVSGDLSLLGNALNNNAQRGLGLTWGRRLTADANLVTTVSKVVTRTLAVVESESRQTTVRADLSRSLSTRSTVNVGLRHVLLRLTSNDDTRETAAFVGIRQRF